LSASIRNSWVNVLMKGPEADGASCHRTVAA
jgi:hypothetical protein